MQVPFSIRFICTCFNSSLLIASSGQIGSCRTVSWLRRHGTDLGVKTKWRICTQLLEIFGDILDIRLPVELSWTWPVTHWRKDIRSICYPTEQKSRSFRIELFSHSINNDNITFLFLSFLDSFDRYYSIFKLSFQQQKSLKVRHQRILDAIPFYKNIPSSVTKSSKYGLCF